MLGIYSIKIYGYVLYARIRGLGSSGSAFYSGGQSLIPGDQSDTADYWIARYVFKKIPELLQVLPYS